MDRQDKNAVENQARRIAEGGEEKDQAMQKDQTSQQPFDPKGDDRTPEKPIGEVAYAHRAPTKKKTGEF
jgi:hypothetical protein